MEAIKERVALIAGAGDEIGSAIGMRFARGGATVIACDVDAEKLAALAAAIREAGGKAETKQIDPSDGGAVKRAVREVLDQYGRIDILVNNCDSPDGKPISEVTDAQWQTCLMDNLNPVFFFCREVLPQMREQRFGRIVNVSHLEYIGWPGKANYAAAKAAIFGLTRALALESAKDAVTVNCVARGDIASTGTTPEQAEKIAATLPVKRIGRPEDVAQAVGFFASDTSRYVTGQTFFVCGGKSAFFSMSI